MLCLSLIMFSLLHLQFFTLMCFLSVYPQLQVLFVLTSRFSLWVLQLVSLRSPFLQVFLYVALCCFILVAFVHGLVSLIVCTCVFSTAVFTFPQCVCVCLCSRLVSARHTVCCVFCYLLWFLNSCYFPQCFFCLTMDLFFSYLLHSCYLCNNESSLFCSLPAHKPALMSSFLL